MTKLEFQEDLKLLDVEYHKALCAFHDNNLIGIVLCQWRSGYSSEFWHYRLNFIDVHKDYRRLSVGTNLLKSLDNADFLDYKILKQSILCGDGIYILPVADRELKAKNYAFIPWTYGLRVPPEKVGVHDRSGNLKS
ncbi:MAG: GNAT family N-acetyltransferase [Nanohaloarchaea archaeon]|nr:GNAT family N-acetyltransferase [Candidatus Nanohaloarchaea archaeon]